MNSSSCIKYVTILSQYVMSTIQAFIEQEGISVNVQGNVMKVKPSLFWNRQRRGGKRKRTDV